eukprot:3156643-Pyramimonas_sp.AAC.1
MSAAAAGCSCASATLSAAPRAVPLNFSTSFDARLCAAASDAVGVVVCHLVDDEVVGRVADTGVEGVAGVADAVVGELASVADTGVGEVAGVESVVASVTDTGVGEVGVEGVGEVRGGVVAGVADAGVGEVGVEV